MRKRTGLAAAVGATAVLALGLGVTLASGQGSGGHAEHGQAAKPLAGGQSGSPQSVERRVLFAALYGRNELSGTPLRKGAGDPDGRGGASVTIDGTTVCFGLTVTNIAQPVAAHIHRGRRSQNGPIVVTFVPPTSGDPGASSGCVPPDSDPAVAQEIQRHPRRFYVNVHTADFPGGAVRGQLFARRR
jgi:CHRD domain